MLHYTAYEFEYVSSSEEDVDDESYDYDMKVFALTQIFIDIVHFSDWRQTNPNTCFAAFKDETDEKLILSEAFDAFFNTSDPLLFSKRVVIIHQFLTNVDYHALNYMFDITVEHFLQVNWKSKSHLLTPEMRLWIDSRRIHNGSVSRL